MPGLIPWLVFALFAVACAGGCGLWLWLVVLRHRGGLVYRRSHGKQPTQF